MATYAKKLSIRRRKAACLDLSSDSESVEFDVLSPPPFKKSKSHHLIADEQTSLIGVPTPSSISSEILTDSNHVELDAFATSPKKVRQVLDLMQTSPLKTSTSKVTQRLKNILITSTKADALPLTHCQDKCDNSLDSPWEFLFDNIEDNPIPKPLRTSTISQQLKPKAASNKTATGRLVISKKNSKADNPPSEKNVWNEVFDSIEEKHVSHFDRQLLVESLTSDYSNESQSPEEDTNLYVDLDFRELVKSPDNSNITEDLPGTIEPVSRNHFKTYGQDRTLLLGDKEDVLISEGDDVLKELLTKISDENDFNSDSVVNINDMRISARLEQENGDLEYILDGLQASLTSTLMISSLLELAITIADTPNKIDKNLDRICRNLIDIVQTNYSLSESLAYINICLICQKYNRAIPKFKSLTLQVLLGLNNKIEMDNLLRINRTRVQEILTLNESYVGAYLQVLKEYKAIDWNVCLSILDLLNVSPTNATQLVGYLEGYFQAAKPIGVEVNRFHNFFEATITNLEKRDITEYDMAVMRCLVLLSTNYEEHIFCDVYDMEWNSNILKYIAQSDCKDSMSKNMILCLIGVLVNLTEWDLIPIKYFHIITSTMTSMRELQSVQNQEILRHIIGYLSLILGQLKIRYGDLIEMAVPQLTQLLRQFQLEIHHSQKLLSEKITLLIHQLEIYTS